MITNSYIIPNMFAKGRDECGESEGRDPLGGDGDPARVADVA